MAVDRNVQIRQLGHFQTRVPARVDGCKRLQVHVYVQTQAMIAASLAYAQAQRGDFFGGDVNPGRVATSLGLYAILGLGVDDRVFQAGDQAAYADAEPVEVE